MILAVALVTHGNLVVSIKLLRFKRHINFRLVGCLGIDPGARATSWGNQQAYHNIWLSLFSFDDPNIQGLMLWRFGTAKHIGMRGTY